MLRAAILSITIGTVLLGCGKGGNGGSGSPSGGDGGPMAPPGAPAAPGATPELRRVVLNGTWTGPAEAQVEVDGAPAERFEDGIWRSSVAMGADGGAITVRMVGADGATLATRVVTIAPSPTGLACR